MGLSVLWTILRLVRAYELLLVWIVMRLLISFIRCLSASPAASPPGQLLRRDYILFAIVLVSTITKIYKKTRLTNWSIKFSEQFTSRTHRHTYATVRFDFIADFNQLFKARSPAILLAEQLNNWIKWFFDKICLQNINLFCLW